MWSRVDLRGGRPSYPRHFVELLQRPMLSDKLKTNLRLDTANQERQLKSLNHLTEPDKFPGAVLEEASLLAIGFGVAIDFGGLCELHVPSIFERFIFSLILRPSSRPRILQKKRDGDSSLESDETRPGNPFLAPRRPRNAPFGR